MSHRSDYLTIGRLDFHYHKFKKENNNLKVMHSIKKWYNFEEN